MIYIAEKKISVWGGLLPGKSFSTCGLQPPLTNLSPKPITNLTIYNIGKITVIKSQQK